MRAFLFCAFLSMFALPAHAEAVLSLDLLDLYRDDGDETFAMLEIISIASPESDDSDSLPPGDCIDNNRRDINLVSRCYALNINDSGLDIPVVRSRQLINVGNASYILAHYAARNADPWAWPHFSAEVGNNGYQNGNYYEKFDLSRLPGTLDPARPFDFLYQRYDDQLNHLYGRMLRQPEFPVSQRKAFVRDQRRWQATVQRDCDVDGDAGDESLKQCLLMQTAKRIWWMKQRRIELGLARKPG